ERYGEGQEASHKNLAAKRIYQFLIMLHEHENHADKRGYHDPRYTNSYEFSSIPHWVRRPWVRRPNVKQQNEHHDARHRVREILSGVPGLPQERTDEFVRQDQPK